MSDREQDKRVAEILGFIVVHEHWMRPVDQPYNYRVEQRLPRFTTDLAADYKVLEWVREHLDETQYNAWVAEVALQNAALNKITEPTVFTVRVFLRDYQPGDYSRALLMLDEQGLLK